MDMERMERALRNADAAGDVEAARTIAAAIRQAQQQPQVSQRAGSALRDIPRQIGLTARYGAEGLAQLAQIGTEPLRQLVVNPALRALGQPEAAPLAQGVSAMLTNAGFPQPETPDERVVGDASRLVAGSIGGARAAQAASSALTGTAQRVAQAFAANPTSQAVSAAGAGAAGGSVREAGGGDAAQFLASMAGAVAAPMALNAATGTVRNATNAARNLMTGRDQVEVTLRTELAKQGVNWDDLALNVRNQLREDAKRAIYKNQPIDAQALRRLADYRAIGATPQLGDITQDPRLLTTQRNLSKQMANQNSPLGAADLPSIDNANAKRVLSTLEGVSTSPLDDFATGQTIIGRLQGKDASMATTENALYGAARDSQGRAIPLARGQFVNAAFENLARENKTAFLPSEISTMLNQISKGRVKVNGQWQEVPFTVDTIDSLKTTLATASRSAKDGNVRSAIKAVRDALEATQPEVVKSNFGGQQVTNQATAQFMQQQDGAPADAMAAFNAARGAARERRTWQESAKFIEDALSDIDPREFVKKHIINADTADLGKLKAEIAKSPQAVEATRKQLVSYILDRGRADSDVTKFSSAGMQDALKQLGDRKLSLFFSADEIQQIKSAVNVGRYMQSQPIGSAVNNSNTAAMLTGRLADLMARGSPIPGIGPLVAQPLQGGLLQLQARQMRNLTPGLLQPVPAPPPVLPGGPALYGGLLALPPLPPGE